MGEDMQQRVVELVTVAEPLQRSRVQQSSGSYIRLVVAFYIVLFFVFFHPFIL